ncbi:hypothetical protein KAH37_10130, partial [bacterium]|nr:hypothetical protein [bacterium]
MKKVLMLLIALAMPMLMYGGPLGPDVAEYKGEKLQWEEGAISYFVMFKSLLENQDTAGDAPGNPQADHCMPEGAGSTYTLDIAHIPQDAHVDRAFLVWTGAVPQTGLSGTLDNEVSLRFTATEGGYTHTKDVEVPAKKLSSASDFSFESYRFPDDPDQAYFTYRTEITEFIEEIHKKGLEAGIDGFGLQLLGDYNLSNLTCADDASYVGKSVMVSGWSIILVFTSADISPKKLYIYNGLAGYFHEQTEINVSGFEFPDDPVIRLTLSSYEGDPGRATLTNPDDGPAFPEGIEVQGDGADWLPLSNVCNPPARIQDATGILPYVEVFNSVSSQYGFSDIEPTCIGGTPPAYNDTMEYAVDMDTFIMNTKEDDGFAAHFYRGGDHINMKIGANQDWALTNFLIVSVDTRAANFDIPGEAEKFVCGHLGQDQDHWCDKNEELWFAIKVQNWGDDATSNVIVTDQIDTSLMEYIPGTTSYAVKFDKDWAVKASDWHIVPDNGAFPLETGVSIAELKTMRACNDGSGMKQGDVVTPEDCPDTALVRFKVKLKGVPKNAVIENLAGIRSVGMNEPYKTNSSIPLRLVTVDSCTTPKIDMTLCGVTKAEGCSKDDDCAFGTLCNTETRLCVPDPDNSKTKNVDVAVSVGKNSPATSSTGAIIVASAMNDLVMGQMTFKQGVQDKKFYLLDQMKVGFNIKSTFVKIENIRLVEDKNNNGLLDAGEKVVGSGEINQQFATLTMGDGHAISADTTHFFLIVADVAYDNTRVKANETYNAYIEKAASIVVSDDGAATLKLTDAEGAVIPKLTFATFMAEPTDGFIVTKGKNDPVVPEPDSNKKITGVKPMLQLRVKSQSIDNTIKSMQIDMNNIKSKKFGEGITSLAVYEDANGDGEFKGDKKLAEVTSFPTQIVTLTVNHKLVADKDAYLLIVANLNLSEGEMTQIRVKDGQFKLGTTKTIYKLPVMSKEFINKNDIPVE